MAANDATTPAPADPNPDPPRPDPPKDDPPTDPPADPQSGDSEPFDKDRAMRTITTLREAEKAGKLAAKERDQLAAKLKEYEEAQLSEKEKLEKRAAELEARDRERDLEIQEMRLENAVHRLAPTLGVADTELALAALDRAKIEYADDGTPKNVADVLTELLEAKPLLKGQQTPPRQGGTNAGSGHKTNTGPELTAEEAEMAGRLNMTHEAYAAFKTAGTLDDYRKIREEQKAGATT